MLPRLVISFHIGSPTTRGSLTPQLKSYKQSTGLLQAMPVHLPILGKLHPLKTGRLHEPATTMAENATTLLVYLHQMKTCHVEQSQHTSEW